MPCQISGDNVDKHLFPNHNGLQEKVDFTRAKEYIITVAPVMPDRHPFIIKFDFRGRMLCTVFEDLFCIDIDCGAGVNSKKKAADCVEQYELLCAACRG